MPITTISDLLALFRAASSNTTTQGRYFEKFCRGWLAESGEFPEIVQLWLWNDWPRRGNVSDIGIDLVAETSEGEFYAVQCKFYNEDGAIPKEQIDSFLAAAGKSYDGATFSRLLLMTTAPLGSNAKKTIEGHTPPCSVIRVDQFDDSAFDWDKALQSFLADPDASLADARRPRKEPRPHQLDAIDAVKKGFLAADRGKLIMACGTGKTFTSLRIMEEVAPEGGVVLYLVPSLMLLAQTLKEWTIESRRTLAPIVVCSDAQIHESDARAPGAFATKRKKRDDEIEDAPAFDATQLTRPATTRPETVVQRWNELQVLAEKKPGAPRPTVVVFSTYQSLETVADAQTQGFPAFDLAICDEAHRTTGARLASEDESSFVKIHDADFIRAEKRLYMTATPRVYGDSAKNKAKEKDALLCSMDDVELFGDEFHKLSFGAAVQKGLLSDYKVLILTVDEKDALKYVGLCRTVEEVAENEGLQKDVDENDLDVDEVAKMIGCWRGLAKISRSEDVQRQYAADPAPMKRAVAFCASIKKSQTFAKAFQIVGEKLFEEETEKALVGAKDEESARPDDLGDETGRRVPITLETEHIDGTFGADRRAALLRWLAGETPNACRVLSNVRCLSEGVDVPNLDAALFIAPRNSQVDVIQAVGRVMRRAPGKRFGYVVLPVVVSSDVEPEVALNNNARYKVIWQVLNALRSHDEKFRVMINQLQVGERGKGPIVDPPDDGSQGGEGSDDETPTGDANKPKQLKLPGFDDGIRNAIYAEIVKRCGDRRYLDEWAKSVAQIAASRVEQIRKRLEAPTPEQRAAFNAFLASLRSDVNANLDENDALDMLTQHMTTLPVFDALFAKNAFSRNNPVVRSLEKVVASFNMALTPEEREIEEQFKSDVRSQIEGISTSQGRQQIIHTLYEQFFTLALPKTAEKLGVVYTPPEVVDYILRSVAYVLKKEFHNRSISRDGVHILDPFTGTGAFISRLLLSGLIRKEDLKRKFREELHANEIMLLAYYIAAVNIEDTYYALLHEKDVAPGRESDDKGADGFDGVDYEPFPGIVLTDTFNMSRDEEKKTKEYLNDSFVDAGTNSERRKRQRNSPIEIIVGNPPYSVGQKSENDANQNEKYPELDKRVAETYVAKTGTTNKKSLYDAYVKAFRWASDRIGDRGIIGFVSNGAYIDNAAMEGFRKCLAEEFSTIYVFNLRGNQRTQGELSRREGGKIFGSGSRAPIAITILVKNPAKTDHNIFYHDVGDYLTREQKLGILRDFQSVENTSWDNIIPNELDDWINQRKGNFGKLYPLGDKKDKSGAVTFFKPVYCLGINTNRDAWTYNFSKSALRTNMSRMVDFYNRQVEEFTQFKIQNPDAKDCLDFIARDEEKIKWTSELFRDVEKGVVYPFKESFRVAAYRPFCKEFLYFDSNFLHRPGLFVDNLFPSENTPNLTICIQGSSENKSFSAFMMNVIPDLHCVGATQCFPLYYYESASDALFGVSSSEKVIDGYVQRSGISDAMLAECRKRFGDEVTAEDVFFYVYGALHSPEYRAEYENELKKELARLDLPKSRANFLAISNIGRELADLHVNYETGESTIPDRKGRPHALPAPYPLEVHIENADELDDATLYRVDSKMKLGTRKEKVEGEDREMKVFDGTLKYNDHIAISGIPNDAFRYIVNGRSPVEWLVERYYRKQDKPSGIIDDPNLWSDDPKYIFNLIPRLVAVALRTNELVERLPKGR